MLCIGINSIEVSRTRFSMFFAGTTALVNPSLAASLTLCSRFDTARHSPESPSSPKAIRSSGITLSVIPLIRAMAIDKSALGLYSSNTNATRWDFSSPYPMKLRIVRFMLSTGEYETLATNLPRSFTLEEIKELYHARWGIETAFRELKYGLNLVNLHGKNENFVKQEIFSAMIMSNFCSRIAGQVVLNQSKKNIHAYKVNWTMAIYLCKNFYREEFGDGKKLMKDIAKYTEAVRPDRSDERNIKAKSFVGFTYRVSA